MTLCQKISVNDLENLEIFYTHFMREHKDITSSPSMDSAEMFLMHSIMFERSCKTGNEAVASQHLLKMEMAASALVALIQEIQKQRRKLVCNHGTDLIGPAMRALKNISEIRDRIIVGANFEILIQAADVLDKANRSNLADIVDSFLLKMALRDDTLVQVADALDTLGCYDLADAFDGIVKAASWEDTELGKTLHRWVISSKGELPGAYVVAKSLEDANKAFPDLEFHSRPKTISFDDYSTYYKFGKPYQSMAYGKFVEEEEEKSQLQFPSPKKGMSLKEGDLVKIRHWDDSVEFATVIMVREDRDLAVIQYPDGETMTTSLGALTHEVEEILPTN